VKNRNALYVDVESPLPRNPKAERTFLAAIILDPSKITVGAKLLTPSDFYSGTKSTALSHNALIFKAMLDLASESIEIHPNAVLDRLRSAGQWNEDLPLNLSQLPDGEVKITDLAYHARVIRSKANQRKMIALGQSTRFQPAK
jgi:replicative DNA helicase